MKRIISWFLLLSMICSLLPLAGFAAGYETKAGKVTLTIQVNTGGGKGTVTGAGEYEIGSTVTVKAYPETGYAFYGWSGEGDRFITNDLDYTFTITEDTFLIADFTTAPFTDIGGRDYYYDPVCWAVKEGITAGTSATTFSPLDNCTRAQVVTFLHRSAGCPMPMPESPFSDVTGGEYYYDAVMWAVGSKITSGTSATTFSPNAPCTRAQVVTFMWRASGCPKASDRTNPFTDIASEAYYFEAVLWAVERGITTGTSATTFSPDATCTRGQIVTFLYRFAHAPTDDAPALEIVYQYPSVAGYIGELVKFSVVVGGGTAPYTYEWECTWDYSDGYESLREADWAIGANTDTLSFYVDAGDFEYNYRYRCKITDARGQVIYSEPVGVLPVSG